MLMIKAGTIVPLRREGGADHAGLDLKGIWGGWQIQNPHLDGCSLILTANCTSVIYICVILNNKKFQ